MYRSFLKRTVDLAISALGLALLLPLLATLTLLVRVKLGSPVLFRQQRPGLHGRPFTLYKFRTLTDARDAAGTFLPDAKRLTPFSRFLRSADRRICRSCGMCCASSFSAPAIFRYNRLAEFDVV